MDPKLYRMDAKLYITFFIELMANGRRFGVTIIEVM